MIGSHRAPSSRRRPAMLLAALTALALVAGAAFLLSARPAATVALTAAPAELRLADVSGQACADRLAAGTAGLSPHAVAWLYACVEAFTQPAPSPSATPSPSSSPTVAPTTPAPTTPPPTTNPPPTTTAPATSPPAALTNCLADPSRCGFPTAATTGPSGTLTASTRTGYSTAGETVANVEIRGCVVVFAPNVTFRNVRINAAGCFWGVQNRSTGLSLVDSEITCGDSNGNAVGSSNFSLTRVNIHGCENGLDVGGGVSLVDSWIHDMVTCCGAHTDGVQIGQGAANVVIRHNTITVPTPGATSAIISWNENDPQQQQVTIDANLLSGGTYVVYCPRQGASDTRITNNRFGQREFGYSDSCTGSHVSVWAGNVVDLTGAPLAAG